MEVSWFYPCTNFACFISIKRKCHKEREIPANEKNCFAIITVGSSGTRVMHFKLTQTQDNQTFWKPLLKRTFALVLPFMLTHLVRILQHVEVDMHSILYRSYVRGRRTAIGFLFVMSRRLVVHVAVVVMWEGRRNYYFDHVENQISKKTD